MRIPWTARRSDQSILKEINPECSLKGLKLKLPYFGHLFRRADSLEKTLMLGKIEGKKRRGEERIRWLDGIAISMDVNLSQLWGIWRRTEEPGVPRPVGSQRGGRDLVTEQRGSCFRILKTQLICHNSNVESF